MTSPACAGAQGVTIDRELAWLDEVTALRFSAYGGSGEARTRMRGRPPPPELVDAAGPYADTLRELELDADGRLLLILAAAPYVAPERLDAFLLQNQATGRRFTEFGGFTGQGHAGFLPTAETAAFLLAADDRARRFEVAAMLDREHPLFRSGLLTLDHRHPDEPPLSAALRVSTPGLHRLLVGGSYAPPPSLDFPAALITTPLDWPDLVLNEETREGVDMIGRWLRHSRTLLHDWKLSRRLKPGYRALFYGPPGTGKTLTACLLGKHNGLPVYRVDLSRVVSKWMGETEKNLAALFDQAEHRDWILFFDEADALFGRRTESNTANDRAANQQIAYLLQRLEDFPGLAVLATNEHAFLDEAFARRFQSTISFPMPDPEARLRLWRESFSTPGVTLARDVDLKELSARYELAGGAITNVLRHACLLAADRRPPVVRARDLVDGARLELQKEGRYLSR